MSYVLIHCKNCPTNQVLQSYIKAKSIVDLVLRLILNTKQEYVQLLILLGWNVSLFQEVQLSHSTVRLFQLI